MTDLLPLNNTGIASLLLPLSNQSIYFMIFRIIFISIIFCFSFFPVFSQHPGMLPEVTAAGKKVVDTRIDNIGYWKKMIRLGYVKPSPFVRGIKSRYTGSIIQAPGITPQNSPDIPVTDSLNVTQSENSLFVDPENEETLINSNNSSDWEDNSAEDVYGADALYSLDVGQSWDGTLFGAGRTNSGDPSTAIGLNGWWYIGKISNDNGQSIAYSKDKGKTWTHVTIATKPAISSGILDKSHLWIDNNKSSPFKDYLYDGWTNFVSDSPDSGQIQIARSTNAGLTWSSPLAISTAALAGNFNHGVNIQTGDNGEVYATWSIYDNWPSDENAIGFAKSIDGGGIFMPATRIIDNIKGIRFSLTGKDMRVNSFPSMTVDLSTGPNRGTIYLVWTNIGFPGINTGNDIDIYLIKSQDRGETWSSPIRVNQDPAGHGKQHYFPWITCDPLTGGICVVYYDDRNVLSTQCETYVSYSYDGAMTWTDFKVSDVSFTPQPIPGLAFDYFGDYIGIQSRNMKVYPIWTDNRNGQAMTYISPFDLGPNPGQPWVMYYSYELSPILKKTRQNLSYGDSLFISLGLKNIGDQPATNATAYLSTSSPYIKITDSISSYGEMDSAEIKIIQNGYSLKVSDTIPDNLKVCFDVRVTGSDTCWVSHFSIESHAPELSIEHLRIIDTLTGNGNGRIDPGETVNVVVTTYNSGDFPFDSVSMKLIPDTTYLSLQEDSVYLGDMDLGQSKQASFTLTASVDVPVSTSVDLLFKAQSGKYLITKLFPQIIGMIVEDWETGNFTKFPWQPGGNHDWMITDQNPWEGMYCANSGVITYLQSSDLSIIYSSADFDSISFYLKTSTEADYDQLYFYIDSTTQGCWSGETPWTRVAFPVTAGEHYFKWSYLKDIGEDMGEDRVWIDYIVFPTPLLPSVDPGPDDTICKGEQYHLHAKVTNYDSLVWLTQGDGYFSDIFIVDPIYYPGPADQLNGKVTLSVTAYGKYGSTAKYLLLRIGEFPIVHISVFPKDTLCSGQTAYLSVDTTGNSSYYWTPGGYPTPVIAIDTSVTGGIGEFLFKVLVRNLWNCSKNDSVQVTFKDCTGLEEYNETFFSEIYPNPSTGIFKLKLFSLTPETISVKIMDAKNIILSQTTETPVNRTWEKTFNLTKLSPGLYIISIVRNTEVIMKKIIILK